MLDLLACDLLTCDLLTFRPVTDKVAHVVTCFLRHRGEVLLLRRSEEVGTYQGQWGGVSGYVETEDPEQDAWREIAEETGLDEAVTLVRVGEPFSFEDVDAGKHWVVHPFLFDCEGRDVRIDWESTQAEWVPPPEILRRETVPRLWTSYDHVAPTLASVRDDRTHGSAYISVRALEVLRDQAARLAHEEADDAWASLRDQAHALLEARPSMVALQNRINRVMHACREEASAEAVEAEAHAGIDRALEADAASARCAAGFVADRRALTLSRSGTVLHALRQAEPPPSAVFVAVSGPQGEGVAVAETLARADLSVTLLPDAAMAAVFEREEVDVLLVGADTLLRGGHVVNKIGTHLAALAAKQHYIPVYAVAATDKVRTDNEPHLEDADPTTLYDGSVDLGRFNPLFEVTPARFFSGIITEDGVLAPVEIEEVAYALEAIQQW